MSAWGTGLYSDDTTCDVRDDYVQNLKHGFSAAEAAQKILDRHGALMEQTEVACLVYFALADTAWRYGRLDDGLKDKALALLHSGADLCRWQRDAPKDVAARRRVLQALDAKLRSPQPAEKPVKCCPPKSKKVRTTAPVGSAFSLALRHQRIALLVLVGYIELENSVDPVFSVLRLHIASPADFPSRITAQDETLVFSRIFREPAHVAILPQDERRSILAGLEQTNIAVVSAMPFDQKSTAWMTLGRIADEIAGHLAAVSPHQKSRT